MKPDHLSDLTFASLDLHPRLLSGLAKLGYEHCTPIQAACLPMALAGKDLAGQAQTGTGKTAAFLLATMQHLLTHPPKGPEGVPAPGAFILAPTRELAVQIYNDAKQLGVDTGLKMTVCYGGAGYEQQRAEIEGGVDILIGTPGRLIDFYKQKTFSLAYVECMVLDEADRMFDLGFIDDIRYLFHKMPKPADRKSYLFSATLSHRVLELAFEHMKPNVEKVEIEPEQVTAERVKQQMVHVSNHDKLPLLVGLVRTLEATRTMVFVNTKRGCEMVERALAGQFQHRLSAHAEADCADWQSGGFRSGGEGLHAGAQATAIGFGRTADTHGEVPRLVEAGGGCPVEIRYQRQVTLPRQVRRLVIH